MVKQTIPAGEFKSKCLSLLEEVRLQRKEITITKRGKPVARLVPVDTGRSVFLGRLKGSGRLLGNIITTGEMWDADK